MRSLTIPYPDSTEFAVAYPVPRARLMLFDQLTTKLRQEWMTAGFNTSTLIERYWWLFRKISQLIPSDPLLPFDVERIKGDEELLIRLFLVDAADDGSVTEDVDGEPRLRPSQLVGLHLFKRREPPPKDPDAPIDPPFPTSGDADCDTLANLLGPFGVEGALRIYNTFDQETIENVLYTWNELQKPLDDRRQEYVSRLFFKEMEKEEYQRSLYEDW